MVRHSLLEFAKANYGQLWPTLANYGAKVWADLVYPVHLVCPQLQLPVLLQGLGHMLKGTVKQSHGLRPLFDGHVGLCHVVAAECLEGKRTGCGLLLFGQVLRYARDVSQISYMLHSRWIE